MSDLPIRRACIGMPGYGNMTAGAALGFFKPTCGKVRIGGEDNRLLVSQTYNQGSLLAQNFNALWCWALTEKHQGKQLDYFAMQHDDVEPESAQGGAKGWLDKLIEEMEERDLDVLGVVVPIKDPNGLTSIAMAKPDGSHWRPLCRLTMSEVYSLPETFTSEDIGHPILLNTGLWVCRFNPEWATQVHFTINDRIVFDKENGRYLAEVEPEDWFFSRRCHELGLKIGATRKVKVLHAGSHRFGNGEAWGSQEFDEEYVSASLLPAINATTKAEPAELLEV